VAYPSNINFYPSYKDQQTPHIHGDEDKVLIDSPDKGVSISPLRKHQRSINNFLDTMKQQYNPLLMGSNRHQHQLDLFENLERELKSIIEVFNNEKY
jgi:hypothetical protein